MDFQWLSKRKIYRAAVGVALLTGIALIGLYVARKPLAQNWINAELKKRGVAAQYELTQLGPDHQRLEHVVIGDPAHPDLTADWIVTETHVGLFGASLIGVKASGVRLNGILEKDGSLHFGSLDKFRSVSTGPFKLPDLGLDLSNARLVLATPYGDVNAWMEGNGNLARDFDGKLAAKMAAMKVGGCNLSPVVAQVVILIRGGNPHLTGPVRSDTLTCAGSTLAHPALNADVTLSPDLRGAQGTLALEADHFTSPLLTKAAQSLGVMNGTPLAPFGAQYSKAILALGGGASVRSGFKVDPNQGTLISNASAQTNSGTKLITADGSWIKISPQGKIKFEGAIGLSGGGLPSLIAHSAGSPDIFEGLAYFPPLIAPNTRLVLTPIQFSHNAKGTKILTTAQYDGPVAGGTLHGLSLPIAGLIGTSGSLALANPCTPVSLNSLNLSSLELGKTAANVCLKGQVVSINSPHLSGHSGNSPFDVAATALEYNLGTKMLEARQIKAVIGEKGHISALTVDLLNGSKHGGTFKGRYSNASGTLNNVPLALTKSSGTWQVVNAALLLSGTLNVADMTPAPNERFEPMVAPDVALRFNKGVITATGTLHEPKSGSFVSRVTITHTLATGSGGANLTIHEMPLLTFGKALQPEALTRATLGVVANLNGAISGEGRIRWTPKGVTSDGDFQTDHMDLAAAFGPVGGLSGKVHFTDLLGLVTAPHQEVRIASVNPGIIVSNGVVHYQLLPNNHIAIEGGVFPFADGQLILEPTVMDLNQAATRRMTFTVRGVDAAKFIAQSGFEDIAATGVFDGTLPLAFDSTGGRIENGQLAVRDEGGTVSYVGAVSNAALGRFGQLAFDALKSIRYHGLKIELNGPLDGEMVTLVKLSGTNESPKAAKKSYLLKQITGIPFKFNIRIRAPFRSLFNTAKNLDDPSSLVQQDMPANLKASAPPPHNAVVHPPSTSVQP